MAVLPLATSLAAPKPLMASVYGPWDPQGPPTQCLDPQRAPGRAGAGVICLRLERDSCYRPCDLREV